MYARLNITYIKYRYISQIIKKCRDVSVHAHVLDVAVSKFSLTCNDIM